MSNCDKKNSEIIYSLKTTQMKLLEVLGKSEDNPKY